MLHMAIHTAIGGENRAELHNFIEIHSHLLSSPERREWSGTALKTVIAAAVAAIFSPTLARFHCGRRGQLEH
jgi:hypothetical protein